MRRRIAAISIALIASWYAAVPTYAHHGWGYYDTSAPLYLVGRVTAVDWKNPHPTVTLDANQAPLPADWRTLPVPHELTDLGFDATLSRTRALPRAQSWTLDLAPINRLESWGMPRAPRVGDEMIAIAFPSCAESQIARPALIVLDGIGVRQQSVALPTGCSSK